MTFSLDFVKTWIETEFSETKRIFNKQDKNFDIMLRQCFDRCYGVIIFSLRLLSDEKEKDELRTWWNDDMRIKFLKETESGKQMLQEEEKMWISN